MFKECIENPNLEFDMEKIKDLPILRLPTKEEIDWLATLIRGGVYVQLCDEGNKVVKGLIEQGYAVEIVHRQMTGCYAATVSGSAFFTDFYDVDTISQALIKHFG